MDENPCIVSTGLAETQLRIVRKLEQDVGDNATQGRRVSRQHVVVIGCQKVELYLCGEILDCPQSVKSPAFVQRLLFIEHDCEREAMDVVG